MKNRMFTITAATLAVAAGSGIALGQSLGSSFTGSIAAAAQNPGLLQINTNNVQQQIEVTIGPVPGEVTVSGVAGIPSGFTYMNVTEINLQTGRAQDFVEFRVLTAIVPNITVNTGAGNSDVKFTYEIPDFAGTVTTNAVVTGGTGNDKVAFNVESRAQGFVSSWNVTHGNGNNDVSAFVNSPELSELMSLSLNSLSGTGADKIEVSLTSAAASQSVAVSGSMGANTDAAFVNALSLVPTTGNALLNIDLGAGNDAASAEFIAPDSSFLASGLISGGDGIDALVFKMESNATASLELNGGAGADLADMFFKGLVEGAPRLIGGLGNDELKIVVDGPQIATPFLDGGPGIDKAIGFGTIINVEEIN